MSYPTHEIEFCKDGRLFDAARTDRVVADLAAGRFTDVFVFAHGWNNDVADARDLCSRFFAHVAAVGSFGGPLAPAVRGRRFAVLLALWPSKRFAEAELIPGGAAAMVDDGDTLDAVLVGQLERMKVAPQRLGEPTPAEPAVRAAVERAQSLIPRLEAEESARREFVDALRSTVSTDDAHPEDGSTDFLMADATALLESLAEPVVFIPNVTSSATGGAAGPVEDLGVVGGAGQAAGGIEDVWGGIRGGARRLLNLTTYYQMKARAGVVGRRGLPDVLRQLKAARPALRLHLIGHSFGGRLVTAAADAVGPAVQTDTLTLLQAAFSHHGLARQFDGRHDGFFRAVVAERKVAGPVLITYTKNDRAVGIAYPLASRIARQNASALLGDADDPYGGMGRNGAQKTPEAARERPLLPAGRYAEYDFGAGRVFNLESGAFIKGHSDICNAPVAAALLAAVAGT